MENKLIYRWRRRNVFQGSKITLNALHHHPTVLPLSGVGQSNYEYLNVFRIDKPFLAAAVRIFNVTTGQSSVWTLMNMNGDKIVTQEMGDFSSWSTWANTTEFSDWEVSAGLYRANYASDFSDILDALSIDPLDNDNYIGYLTYLEKTDK